ncbi:MAG TPA: Uma2 family endonuclease [Phototrophicaceae bacterium]|nr:Uma2 family endonuclease [Phototrophicaceae bacterium]
MQPVVELVTNLRLSGEIIAKDVPYEDFLHGLYGEHVEWYEGYVIRMATIDQRHDALIGFFTVFLEIYLDLTGGGRTLRDPMVMRTRADLPVRAPDIQVLLPEHLDLIEQYEVVGAADLVIEVVSPGSERRNRIEKFNEYERAGVPEYWILDHRHQEALFYQLDAEGHYQRINPDDNGIYHSVVLKRLKFEVALLWQEKLPKGMEIVRMVEAMLAEAKS